MMMRSAQRIWTFAARSSTASRTCRFTNECTLAKSRLSAVTVLCASLRPEIAWNMSGGTLSPGSTNVMSLDVKRSFIASRIYPSTSTSSTQRLWLATLLNSPKTGKFRSRPTVISISLPKPYLKFTIESSTPFSMLKDSGSAINWVRWSI